MDSLTLLSKSKSCNKYIIIIELFIAYIRLTVMKEMINIERHGKERILYIDILRILSVFSVVVLHVSAPLLSDLYSNGTSWWWVGNIIDSLTRWSVPILIMVSGALLLDSKKEQSALQFLKRRMGKIIIPLIFWSFAYMAWVNRADINITAGTIRTYVLNFYEGNVHIHLWYMYMIVGLYLITPILKVWIKHARVDSIKYLVIVWFIVNGIINFIQKFTGLQTGFIFDFFHWSIGYYVLSILINRLEITDSRKKRVYILGALGYIVTVVGTYIFTKYNGGQYVPHFYSFYAPNVIFMTIGVYVLGRDINWNSIIKKESFLYKMILELSSTSFGIYLVHLLILDILSSRHMPIKLNAMTIHPIIGVPLASITAYIGSYLAVKALSMIPIIRKAVPR